MKRIITIFSFVALLFSLSSTVLYAGLKDVYQDERVYGRAKVTKIEKKRINTEVADIYEIKVHLKVLEGEFKGQDKLLVYNGEDSMPKDMFYKEGDTVFIGIANGYGDKESMNIAIYDVDNSWQLIAMGVLLVVAIFLVGRFRGLFSLLSLGLSVMLMFYLLIPITLKGMHPLPVAVAIAIVSIIITIPIITGFQKKTIAAILGSSMGIIVASLLSLLTGVIMHLSGIVTDEMLTVFYVSDVNINVRGLALSAMVISALGAVIDVSISISSAAAEIYTVHPEISKKEAYKSVMVVSRDMLGATVNTLLFAYVGSSLPLALLIGMKLDSNMPISMIFNYNPILSEVVKSIIGCIGMFLSMPITALVAVMLYHKKDHSEA